MKISDLVGKKNIGVKVRVPADLVKKTKGALTGTMKGTFTGKMHKDGRVVRLAVKLGTKTYEFRPQDVALA